MQASGHSFFQQHHHQQQQSPTAPATCQRTPAVRPRPANGGGGVTRKALRNKTILECGGFHIRKKRAAAKSLAFDRLLLSARRAASAPASASPAVRRRPKLPGMNPFVARLKLQEHELYPQLQPDRAYTLTPIKDAPAQAQRPGLFARRRQLACDLDELAKGMDTVKLQSAAKQLRPVSAGDDAMMAGSPPR